MQIEIEKIATSPSRSGRQLQRYNLDRRQVVGCIPYRYLDNNSRSVSDNVEVLLISSQKSEKMMFPKGGWETNESMEQAVIREAIEEAGIIGTIQYDLGVWMYQSKSQDKMHDGHMFALLFDRLLEEWPEKDVRRRKWVKVEEAKRLCPYSWMNAALDSLIEKLLFLQAPSSSLSSSSSTPPPPPPPPSSSSPSPPCSMNSQHHTMSTGNSLSISIPEYRALQDISYVQSMCKCF